ncbi:MAG: hypothetical protein LBM96_07225, partial [Methanobrevibacter sp.]|nr:hypothetical protein [Candidatus Methanoflexus mossambicus]
MSFGIIATISLSGGVFATNVASSQYTIDDNIYDNDNDYFKALYSYEGSSKDVLDARNHYLSIYNYKGSSKNILKEQADLKKIVKSWSKPSNTVKNNIATIKTQNSKKYDAVEIVNSESTFKKISIDGNKYSDLTKFLNALIEYNGNNKDINT